MTRLSNCHEDAKELSKEFVTSFVFFLAPLRVWNVHGPNDWVITLVETIPKMKYLITLLKSIIGIR